jgi:hypothetical protein
LAQKCHGDKPPESRVGLSFGAFRSRLIFTDRGFLDLEEVALGASYERKLSKTVTFQISGGGIAYGRLGGPGAETLRGFFAGAGASWAVVDQKGAIPFVMIGVSLAASLAVPERGGDDALYALDIRGSVTAGYTLAQRFTPYLVGRLFGGPVVFVERGRAWAGTDIYHFQLGAGLVVGLPGGFDLSAEIVPLGEQRVSAGVGYSF